jgi:hypothetical protein
MALHFFLKIQVSRADAGTYECRATNPLGESAPAEQEIVVHCKYILWNELALSLDITQRLKGTVSRDF